MNTLRLTQLRDVLYAYPQSASRLILPAGKDPAKFRFDLTTFGRLDPDCHTSACAAGLAAMLPIFRAQGLSYYIWDDDLLVITFNGQASPLQSDAFPVMAKFLGISLLESHLIFDPHHYPLRSETPVAVAAQIDKLLAGRPTCLACEQNIGLDSESGDMHWPTKIHYYDDSYYAWFLRT